MVTQIISEVLKTSFFPNAFPQIVAKTLRYSKFPRDPKAGISWYHVTNQSTHVFGNGFIAKCLF